MRLVVALLGLALVSGSVWAGATDRVAFANRVANAMKISGCKKTDTGSIDAAVIAAVDRANHHRAEGLYEMAQQETGDLAVVLFVVADEALKLGCRKIADHYYRQVLSIFTGTAYAAYRQRAMVGIEDVRKALPAR